MRLVRTFGPAAAAPMGVYLRRWGVDPWAEGSITAWRLGDLLSVGALHRTHDPPFYVCGACRPNALVNPRVDNERGVLRTSALSQRLR